MLNLVLYQVLYDLLRTRNYISPVCLIFILYKQTLQMLHKVFNATTEKRKFICG